VKLDLDPESRVPLYEQIAVGVREAIADGSLAAGSPLPTGGELAEELGVHRYTVLRAYSRLRDEGLVDVRPRRGAVVRLDADPARSHLLTLARSMAAEARRQGLSDAELVELVRDAYS